MKIVGVTPATLGLQRQFKIKFTKVEEQRARLVDDSACVCKSKSSKLSTSMHQSVIQVTSLREEVNSLQALLLQKRIREAVDGRGNRDSNDDEDDVIDLSS